MAYTEFCCRSGGSNMNGGAIASNGEPATTPVYSATNGGWNSGTGVFTPTSGNPSLTVTVGDFANVFTDGSTTPVFVGRVTAVNSTTITVSTTAKSGTAPTTAGTGISINVGGAWAGPSGTVKFPFDFVDNLLVGSASGIVGRVNLKNDQTYSTTANINHSKQGPVIWQGYTSTFGDKGKFVVDGGNPGSSFILLSLSSNGTAGFCMGDFEFRNNGTSGSSVGLDNFGDPRVSLFRGIVHDIRGAGINGIATGFELEVYACNKSNTNNSGGITLGSASKLTRCISHHNAGSNSCGFYDQSGGAILIGCIGFSNGKNGYRTINIGNTQLLGCDFYDNASDGILFEGFSGNTRYLVENCNLVKNGGYGISYTNSIQSVGWVSNCGFGSGTQANTSGATNGLGSLTVEGSVTYPANTTPWVDPVNGDFRINLAQAKNAGIGRYTETASGYAGTVGYPDIGAAQHQDAGGASGPVAQLKQFGRGAPY